MGFQFQASLETPAVDGVGDPRRQHASPGGKSGQGGVITLCGYLHLDLVFLGSYQSGANHNLPGLGLGSGQVVSMAKHPRIGGDPAMSIQFPFPLDGLNFHRLGDGLRPLDRGCRKLGGNHWLFCGNRIGLLTDQSEGLTRFNRSQMNHFRWSCFRKQGVGKRIDRRGVSCFQ